MSSTDSDPIYEAGSRDLISSLTDIVSGVQYKLLIFMFVIFLFVSSDMFIMRLLSRFSGAVDMKTPTNYGTILQGTFIVLACIVIDGLINQKVI